MTPTIEIQQPIIRRRTKSVSPPSSTKTRRYVVVFQCPVCKKTGYVDDFEGEYDVACCDQTFTVSLTEGLLPDWSN